MLAIIVSIILITEVSEPFHNVSGLVSKKNISHKEAVPYK